MGASSSSSAANVVTWRGYHLFEIRNYSRIKAITPNGSSINSSLFRVGMHKWHLEYYPNGDRREVTDHASLYLKFHIDEFSAKPVNAYFVLRFVDDMSNDKMKPPSDEDRRCAHAFTSTQSDWGFYKFIRKDELERSGRIVDDVLTIRCDLDVNQFCTKKHKIKPPMASYVYVPPRDLGQQFGALLSSMVGADVTFQVGGKRFMAHRCVLAARSPVFKVELYGPMEESNAKCVIKIDDMEPKVFEALLGFIYTDSLPEMKKQNEMAMAQLLLGAADRYDIKRLRLMCEDKLCRHVNKSTVTNLLTLVDQRPSCEGLRKACFEFLLKSPKVLQDVMATKAFDHLINELLLCKIEGRG